ncbi:WhiB family transcriptional regulator [Kitasatospora griseola]|uniref:WhiB family transcriptional regulator n=1 Tax=Kitasatospora griseola TaxID=2064 RepID=UPI0016716597|nr:WhiB family transcriptional regulator [Kitasatospora griseola]GGQ70079.1 redox-responsive transcriptional regulator WhiB3 [Kitasatospora griseola]
MKPPITEPLLNQWGWQARAACRGMDSAVFFSPCGEQGEARRMRERRARSVCRDCPVRLACASFAVRTGQDFGIWGGLTEADRLAARKG